MKTLTVKQKRIIEKHCITAKLALRMPDEPVEWVFFIAGCYVQQKQKPSEIEALRAGIEYVLQTTQLK